MKTTKFSLPVLALLAILALGCSKLGIGSRPDSQVATDVQAKIYADSNIPEKVQVSASNGVVTLSGNVSSDAARNAAASDAAQVAGVKTVVNNLQVGASTTASTLPPENNTMTDLPAPAVRHSGSHSRSQRPSAGTGYNNGNSSSGQNYGTPPADTGSSSAMGSDPQPAAVPAPPPAPKKVTIAAGTQLSIRINQELDSEKAQIGDVFQGSISAPITVDGETVIPTTADVEGRVVEVKSAGRFAGQSVLTLELTRLTMNGRSYSIQTDRWSKSGSGRGKSTAEKVGGGAAVGAVLGGIFGGGKGAAIGAAAGAGAGTGVSAATKGQQILLKPEAMLAFQLTNPLTVTPGTRQRNNQ